MAADRRPAEPAEKEESLVNQPRKCPVCASIEDFEEGDTVNVGIGNVQCGPDRCHRCGYIQAGPDPDDKPIEHYQHCWKEGVDPHPAVVKENRAPLKPEYAAWIALHVEGDGYGRCLDTSLAMQRAFPHLRLVRGQYYDYSWGQRAHFWLVDAGDEIVDPTAAQFPTGGSGVYAGSLVPPESHLFKREGASL